MQSNKKITHKDPTLQLNFGPQHPAAHGVLRGVIYVKNEIIKQIEVHIGLLHRGTEKLSEFKNPIQILPYFDRLDYVSMLAQEHTFILTVEKIFGLQVNKIESLSRMLLLEITRILNHLMGLTTHAIDVGAFTPFLWGFEDREKLMEFYEQISGARMHAALFLPGESRQKISITTLKNISNFSKIFKERLNELSELLSENPIWISRLKNIGNISASEVLNYGFSGPIARSAGIFLDIRKDYPYELYKDVNFFIPVSQSFSSCDSLDRFYIRLLEMYESIKMIDFICQNLIEEKISHKNFNSDKLNQKLTMENLINHFKFFSSSYSFNKSENKISNFVSTETPKGELGCLFSINKTGNVIRNYIRPSGFSHVNYLNIFNKESFISDLVTTIGSADLVFGEIDR
jgi:NADH:ubiquinone oxidoreductase subunit D